MPVKALIFDLGDVLFTWSASTTTSIPQKTLHAILKSDAWIELDCGRISRDQCYEEVAHRFCLQIEEIRKAFAQARASLHPNHELVAGIQKFKKSCQGEVVVFAMSNVSREDYAFMASEVDKWAVFDRVFTSGHTGMRKPDPAFYRHVLREARMQPDEVVFIDDKAENVRAAEGVGMRAQIFTDTQLVVHTMRSMQDKRCDRAHQFLTERVRSDDLSSITASGLVIPDNFARFLIQDTLPMCHASLPGWNGKRTWNFFTGNPVNTPNKTFPDDLDTTALALTVIPTGDAIATSVLDDMAQYALEDGNFQVYVDWAKPRVDEIVSANVLASFYRYGRGHELPRTLNMIRNALLHRAYESGTRYYPYADCCLYFVLRLMLSADDACLRETLEDLLKERVAERVGKPGNAVELAMRVVSCRALGVTCSADIDALVDLQQDDGGWPAGWLYRYGSTGDQIGNRGVTTAMAIKALAFP